MIFGEISSKGLFLFVLLFLLLVGKISNFISFVLFYTSLIDYL